MDEEDERTQHMIDTGRIFGPDGNNPLRADDSTGESVNSIDGRMRWTLLRSNR